MRIIFILLALSGCIKRDDDFFSVEAKACALGCGGSAKYVTERKNGVTAVECICIKTDVADE